MGYQLQYITCSNGGSFNTTLAAPPTVDSVITIQFLETNTSYHCDLKYGVDYADFCIRGRSYLDMYWHPKQTWDVRNYLTYNDIHTASVSNTQYTFDENTIAPTGSTVSIPSSSKFILTYFYGNLYGFNSIANSTYDFNLVPWINDNDVVGLMDLVSNTFYTPAGGTWTAGPKAHVFEPSKSSLTFPASGGSITFDVEAETTWTASTPTFATLSPSTGGTGTTTVTATCPSYTGTTKREETITFTDNDNYTFDVKIRQRALTNGISNLYLGDNQIPTANAIYLGDAGVNTIYLGEEIVYSSGPFVGLKVKPLSLSFNNSNLTKEITIQSSENWTITDDSTVGGYYTLQNYTTGCDGWVPSYDGSLDGGEIDENGKWFEWQQGVSEITFQEYLENLASYGITATGTACQNARYSVYLAPHSAGGPSWLSYSQTTGTTGKTVITVTASTTQTDRTATITVTSANYSATISVDDLPVQFYDYFRIQNKYFQIPVTPTINTRVECDNCGFVTFNNDYPSIYGIGNEWDNSTISICGWNGGKWLRRFGNHYTNWNASYAPTLTLGQKYNMSLDKNKFIVNGIEYNVNATTFTANNKHLTIGARNDTNSSGVVWMMDGYVGDFRVYDGNTLVMELKPSINNGVYSYYDTVGGVFYASLGNGTISGEMNQ